MTIITRRSVLRNSLAVAAAGTLARPFIANAAAPDRDRVVDPGLRARGGRRIPQDGRGLPEAERQHDRLQHRALCAADAEDHLGDHQRRRSRSDLA